MIMTLMKQIKIKINNIFVEVIFIVYFLIFNKSKFANFYFFISYFIKNDYIFLNQGELPIFLEMDDSFSIDPTDFAKYATIEDVLREEIYHDKKVRVLGTVIQNDKDSRKIVIAHNEAKIECSIPNEYVNLSEENQTCQVIGTVIPLSPNPIINAIIVKPLNCVDQKTYDYAVQKFNEYLFQ